MGRARVVVVGDVMIDRYIWGQVERISPEAPVPVVAVEDTNTRPGGAANVALNLASLGVGVELAGVLGRDYAAREIRSLLAGRGLSTGSLITDAGRVTTEKIRIVAHQQQVVRADFESGGEIGGRVLARFLLLLRKTLAGAAAVVVSDYGKGIISAPVMDAIRSVCSEAGTPVFVDPKEGRFSLYRKAFAVTPNKREAGGFYNVKLRTEEELEEVGRSLLRDLEAEVILITRGEEGMTLFQRGRRSRHFPTRAREVYDVTGAGDTVISVLAGATAAGAPIKDAIELANAAAGIVIRELGTAAVSPEELAAAFSS